MSHHRSPVSLQWQIGEADDQIPVFLQEPVPCRGDEGGVVGRWMHECVDHGWHPPLDGGQVQTQLGVQVVCEGRCNLSGRTRSRDEPDRHLVRAHGGAAGLRRGFRPSCVMVRVSDHHCVVKQEARSGGMDGARTRRRGRIAALRDVCDEDGNVVLILARMELERAVEDRVEHRGASPPTVRRGGVLPHRCRRPGSRPARPCRGTERRRPAVTCCVRPIPVRCARVAPSRARLGSAPCLPVSASTEPAPGARQTRLWRRGYRGRCARPELWRTGRCRSGRASLKHALGRWPGSCPGAPRPE